MKSGRTRNSFLIVIMMILLMGAFGLSLRFARQQPELNRTIQAESPVTQATNEITSSSADQVVVGTPEFYGEPVTERYHYRNEYENHNDLSERLPLYLIDVQTGQKTRLGNALGSAAYSGQNEDYMLWHFFCDTECDGVQPGLHAYHFKTRIDDFISSISTSIIHPQISGQWLAFGRYRPEAELATLYAGNIQTHEVIIRYDEPHP
ncbi:MAG: hypothetical protein R3A44_14860 [Caldilineaceae bacterium]